MEPITNRFYCYGNVYISTGKDQDKTTQAHDYEHNRGLCESCDRAFSTPTFGLSNGKEWVLCAECRLGLDLASGKSPYKTRLCYWFKTGDCPAGELCTFKHGPNDKGINTPVEPAAPPLIKKNNSPHTEDPEQETPKYKAISGNSTGLSTSSTEPQ